jgi:hypothetical protein
MAINPSPLFELSVSGCEDIKNASHYPHSLEKKMGGVDISELLCNFALSMRQSPEKADS